LGGVGLFTLACSGEQVLGDYPPSSCDLAEPPVEFHDTPLSIATFWATDMYENDALQTLLDRVDRSRYFVQRQEMTTRVDTQRHINDSFATQQLPDVFQVNGGNDVLRWVEGRGPDKTDVCALDRLRDTYGYRQSYFESALAPLSCHDHLYGLPVGIHHLNVLFYNRKLFSELQVLAEAQGLELTEPSALKDPHELVAELELVASLGATTSSGAPIIPLAIGAQSAWPLTIVAFENVLLGLGHDAYETLWMGGLERDDGTRRTELAARLEEMVSVLRGLTSFSNVSESLSWQQALQQVGAGEALVTITGDWGYAQLGADVTTDVATTTFPGTSGAFVYTPDSFAVPRELKKNGFPARSFLHEIVETKDALIEFSRWKHSIPPRSDLSAAEIASLGDDVLRDTYRRFKSCEASNDCKLLLAVSGLGPPPGTDPCFDEIDALLTLAVTGQIPTGETLDGCQASSPLTRETASARLIELLLKIGEQRFASDCR